VLWSSLLRLRAPVTKSILLVIFELACIVSAGAQTLIHTSQAIPSQPPAATTTVQAASASEFLNSIGVACHFDYYWTAYQNFPEVEALLLQSGIRNIRDGGTDPIAVSSFRALHNDGIDVTWVMDAIDGVAPTSAYWTAPPHYTLPSFLENVLGTSTISAIEISNEIDIYYGTIKWHPSDHDYLSGNYKASNYWGAYIQSLVQDTSTVVHQDAALASIPLIGTSFGGTWAGVPAGAFYPFVDQGAIHPYMYRGNATVTNAAAYDGLPHYFLDSTEPSVLIDEYPTAITNFNFPYQSGSQQKPLVATETGYYTGRARYSIDESRHAKYVPRIFAESFRHSIAKTFVYEFVDEGLDGGMENSFGLVRANLTPKPAYTALQSMIALLQDSGGSFSPAELTYGFVPSQDQSYTRLQYAHDLLLQKRDGDFFLLFWHEISDASRVNSYGDAITGTDPDASPAALPAVITVPANITKATLYSYDPNWQLQATPLTINAGQIQVQVSDELSVVRLQTASTAPSATTTKLQASASQITAGQPLSLSATVMASSGSDKPSGTVTFYLGQTQIGTATLAGGAATLSVASNFFPGNYNLTATYSGSSEDDASTSTPLSITIAPVGVATTTTLLSSASQLTEGQPFSLSAAVAASSGSVAPSGTVTFYLGQRQIGTATLAGGKASLSVNSSFPPGTYSLTATYSGGSADDPSTSAPISITVAPLVFATTTTLSILPQQPVAGQMMTLQVNVRTTVPGNDPSGAVTLYLNGSPIGVFMIAGGTGTFSMKTPPAGAYTASAVFATQGDYLTSQSSPVTFAVLAATAGGTSGSFTVALSNDSVSMSVVNPQPASLQVAVSTSGNYTGSIQLGCSGLPAGISCSFLPASLTVNATKVTSTLVLSVPATQTADDQMALNLQRALLLPWGMLSIFGLACRRKCGRAPRAALLTLGLLCSMLWTTGCGLTINDVTRSYSVSVTAIDQNHVTETTTFTLHVTQPGMTR
jgi:hypothetical protein